MHSYSKINPNSNLTKLCKLMHFLTAMNIWRLKPFRSYCTKYPFHSASGTEAFRRSRLGRRLFRVRIQKCHFSSQKDSDECKTINITTLPVWQPDIKHYFHQIWRNLRSTEKNLSMSNFFIFNPPPPPGAALLTTWHEGVGTCRQLFVR